MAFGLLPMSDKIRILICKTCGSAQELPWYEGDPKFDTWLINAVENHPKFGDGRPHVAGGLFNINVQQLWNTKERRKLTLDELYTQLEIPGTGEGMGQEYYDLKSNFHEDAMSCWKGFNRTTDPGFCDYRKENKKIVPDTLAERKEADLDPQDRPQIYLCDFCPVQTLVQQKIREARGLYK